MLRINNIKLKGRIVFIHYDYENASDSLLGGVIEGGQNWTNLFGYETIRMICYL